MLAMLTLASVFPVSAGLYLTSRHKHDLQELRKDFKLLGLDSSAPLLKHYSQPFTYVEFLLHSLLPFVLTWLGAILLAAAIKKSPGPFEQIDALGYGFLGAYIFCIQLIYRRYTTFDLQPSVYMNCTLTLIAGLAFNYTAFTTIAALAGTSQTEGIGAGLSAIVAFSLGYFPMLAIRWFNELTNAALGNNGYRIDSLPLSVIDGISQFHETRLRDEGIDNVQNLASVKIDHLLASTPFNAQQALEWIDQAILISYIDPGNVESFRRIGVRKVSDFLELWAPYHLTPVADVYGRQQMPKMEERLAEERRNRAMQLQSTPEYLDTLYMAVRTGPNIAYVETYWKNLKASAQERAAQALEDEQKDVRSLVTRTQLHIFREIGKHDLQDRMRKTLGDIASTMTEDTGELAADEDFAHHPDALVGVAWWLWQRSNEEEGEEVDYTGAAGRYYERALAEREDDPRLLHELSAFYAATGDYEQALETGEQAVPLFQEAGQTRRALLTQMMTAMVCMKAGQVEDGRELLKDVTEMLDAGEIDGGAGSGALAIRGATEAYAELFGEEGIPEEFAALQSRLASMPAADGGQPVIPTIDIPPA